MAPTVHLVLVPGSRALRDLAAGGAFVGGCESLSLTDLCELVVEGAGHKLTIGATVVYLDGNGNAGIELDPSRRAELIAFVEAYEAGPAPTPSEPERADSERADSERADSERADSERADSERADSERADSERAELHRAELNRADSERADSERADSERAELHRAELRRGDSARGDSERAELHRAELHRAELHRVELHQAQSEGPESEDAERAELHRAHSERAELHRAHSERAELGSEQVELRRAESERLESKLPKSELFDFSFSESELAGAGAESSATDSGDDELVLTFADEEPIARGSDAAIENVRDPDDPEPTERIDPLDPGELEDDDEPSRTLHERLRGLTLAEQLKRAQHGDVTERTMLERMYGKNVWEALLRNPRLTAPEVARIARMGSLPKPQLEVIVGNGGWLQIPEVRRALLSNPRLSPDQILRVLRLMPKHELKLAGSQTVYPHAVRDAAKRLAKTESR